MVPFTSRDPRSHECLQDNHLTLTVRDRILLHLLEYIMSRSNHWVPFQVTQPGISDAVGIKPRHIQQYIRPMIVQGLVEERSAVAHGGRQRRKTYLLTSQGETEAAWLSGDMSKG